MQKVLIIDDDPDVLLTLKSILSNRGFEVDTVSKHENIYSGIATFKPHVILMDVNLKGEDGRVICKEIKTNSNTKNTPVILFSGDRSIKDHYKDFLAEDFIEKPVKIHSLVHKLKNTCSIFNKE